MAQSPGKCTPESKLLFWTPESAFYKPQKWALVAKREPQTPSCGPQPRKKMCVWDMLFFVTANFVF
jgi:hypothetical protein